MAARRWAHKRMEPVFPPLPWPDLPATLGYAVMDFTPDCLLASEAARHIEIPPMLRMARPKRRSEYVAGRLCALAASRQAGCTLAQLGRRSNGAPDWPVELCGSIAHSAMRAVAVVGQTRFHRSIGIDIEQILPLSIAHLLVPNLLTPAECTRFGMQPSPFVISLIFSLKEALFKLLHPLTGVMFWHQQAELVELSSEGHATVKLNDTLSTEWYAGRALHARWIQTRGYIFSLMYC